MSTAPTSEPGVGHCDFHTTRWTIVLSAGARHDAAAEDALAVLCDRYWLPLYAYVRRNVADVHQAQDLTQAFFARLLEKRVLEHASPERGRFRAFLLTSLKNFLANEWDRERSARRGAGKRTLSLDFDSGETHIRREPAHTDTAERIFERRWAWTLLDVVMKRLEAEFTGAGKERMFEVLRQSLAGNRDRLPYAGMSAELGMSEDAVRQAVHRLRKRYREVLRDEVAQTVAIPEDIEDELRRLLAALSQ